MIEKLSGKTWLRRLQDLEAEVALINNRQSF